MADFLPQAPTGQAGHGHEANNLVVKGLIIFAVVLVAVGIVVELCLVYRHERLLQRRDDPEGAAPLRYWRTIRDVSRSSTSTGTPDRPGQDSRRPSFIV